MFMSYIRTPGIAFAIVIAAIIANSGCSRPLTPAAYASPDNVATLRTAFQAGAKEATTEAVAAAEPTGWATLKGSFKLSGTAPARAALNVDKDTGVCMAGGKRILSDSLITGPKNELQGALIFLNQKMPDAKWEHPSYEALKTATIDFDQKACIFLTHTVAVRSTQVIRIINSDPIGHNTKIDGSGKMSSFNQTISANDSVMYKPGGESPEPASVACSIHPWMSANLISRDNPYFAVTAADGTFAIENIPAGVPLEFRVWHEGLGGFVSGTVTLNGSPAKLTKGKLAKLTAKDKEVVDWNFEFSPPK